MPITVRKATESDLENFKEIRGQNLLKLHKSRLSKQKRNKAAYLIAFNKKLPVGHVFINYDSKETYHDCPILQDLFVKKSERKKGAATKILKLVQKFVKNMGEKELGIDVDIRDTWIKNFYEKTGFKVVKGPVAQSWKEKDSGKIIKIKIYHLKKKLIT